MKGKIIAGLVLTLLIASAVLPVVGIRNDYKTPNVDEAIIETEQQGFLGDDFDWQRNGENISTGHGGSYPSGNVGIGTTNPLAKLHVTYGGILITGNVGGTPAPVHGTIFMWIPERKAFRAGYSSSNHWYDENIGSYSFATGYNTEASGGHSYAMGQDTTATGKCSWAIGGETTASGYRAIAMGSKTTASGADSTAMGCRTSADGSCSTSMGYYSISSGNYSTAMGRSTTANGIGSTAMGYETTANGHWSTAMGYETTASGECSTAMGFKTSADGKRTTAIGTTIKVEGNYSVGIGLERVYPVYEVTASNVMSIMGGNVGIGTINPSYLLHVLGEADIVAEFSGRVKGAPAVNDDEFVTKAQVKHVISTNYTPTGSSDTSGEIGDTAWDNSYFYVKTPDGWKRSQLETWETPESLTK